MSRAKRLNIVSLFFILSIACFIAASRCAVEVKIEYFYISFASDCPTCPIDPDIKRVDDVILEIERDYQGEVVVERLDFVTEKGLERWNYYGLGIFRPTVVINPTSFVNGSLVMQDTAEEPITKEKLADAIDAYLGRVDTNPLRPVIRSFERFLASEIFLAFSMGLMNGFSPCLLAMLAFILSYSAGTSGGMKAGLVRSLAFALGLVTAIVVVAILIMPVGFYFLPQLFAHLQVITFVAAAILIAVGLSLMGVLKLPISSASFVQRLAKDYFFSNLLGLFFLGILFFFVKVPCAFPLFITLVARVALKGTLVDFSLFAAFSVGLLTPFLGVAVVGGGTPRLARGLLEKYRLHIRALSGIILIAYAVWLLLVSYL